MTKWWQWLLMGVLFGLLATGVILLVSSPRRGKPVELLPPPTPSPVTVYVSGSVVNPGVYVLEAGSRVNDAVQAAGGVLPEADVTLINLAAVIKDGDRLWVPVKVDLTQTAASAAAQTAISSASTPAPPTIDNPLNINTATEAQLDLLPGIGPVKAAAIVQYRQQNGPFMSIDELANVPGISAAVYEGIKDLVTIAPKP
jgi:competence protein ComEA